MSKRITIVLSLGLMVLAACGGGAKSGGGGGTFTTIFENHAVNPGLPINPFNAQGGNAYEGYNQLQLGYSAYDPTDPNKTLPGLARTWKLSADGSTLTVWLQDNARWSDGKPVTSTDVKTSFAIAFAYSNVQGYFLDQVSPVTDKEIRFTRLPGASSPRFQHGILVQDIVPDSVWGREVPSDIWDTITTSQYLGDDPARTAAAKQAQAALDSLSKKFDTFGPTQDVSAGPYVLQSLNSGEAVLVKNQRFFDAARVQPGKVVLLNYTGNQQIWNYLQAGRLDAAPYTAMPTNVLNQILRTRGNKKVTSVSYVAASLAFNQSVYPYGLPAVRQAIAYVLDRPAIQKVGEPVSGIVDSAPDGMVEATSHAFLDSSQLSRLNRYGHDTARAAQLLQGAGFTKQNGQWTMPNGQPWKITVWAVSGFSDWIEAASLIANELTQFGVPSDTQNATDYASYQVDQKAGKYPVSFYLDALASSGIATAYGRIYGAADGYNVKGGQLVRGSHNNWINAPETVNLSGYGTVNPGQLTYELGLTSDLSKERSIVARLAMAVNESLPVIELWDYINVQFVNTNRWTSFPEHTDAMLNNTPGVWIINGYVQPK